MVFEGSEVPEFFGRATSAGPLAAEPVTSVPAGKVLKMCSEVEGRVRIQWGVFCDVSVRGFPVSDPGSWFCLAEIDSFEVPGGGWVEGDANGVFVDSV